MSSIRDARSTKDLGRSVGREGFPVTAEPKTGTAAVCRGAAADLGASIRSFYSSRATAMCEKGRADLCAGTASLSRVRGRFRARDGPAVEKL